MILSLASVRAITRLPTMALFVFVLQSSRVEVACVLSDGEQVAGSLALVDSKLAGCVLDALPVLPRLLTGCLVSGLLAQFLDPLIFGQMV